MSPARAAEFRRRLGELAEAFATMDDSDPEGQPWGVVLAVYPMSAQVKEPSDD
jgi:hypothetical protein